MKIFLIETFNVLWASIMIVLLIAAIAPVYEPPLEDAPEATSATGTR
jgi:hypothetical protein